MDNKPQAIRILFVDDDAFSAREYVDALRDAGFSVTFAKTVQKALKAARENQFAAVILDVRMNPGGHYSAIETAGGFATGMSLARDLKELLPGAVTVALTASRAPEVEEYFSSDSYSRYFYRPSISPSQFSRNLKRLLRYDVPPKVFLVHGRDHVTREEVRRFLRDRLGFRDLIVLEEERSGSRTVIEKLEQCSDESDFIFVILTPDDVVLNVPGGSTSRARQNVILECGYFFGRLGRGGGQVILLKKGHMEMPSDLSGIVYVDISSGIDAAESAIRKEVAHWL